MRDDGTVLGEGMAGPATTRLGIDASWAALSAAGAAALAEAGLPTRRCACRHRRGRAGPQGAREGLQAMAQPWASAAFFTDASAACAGAHNGGDGAIVIVGTGSCGIARLGGVEHQVGGYGFPVSDEGSGAWLGLMALRAALPVLDGRAPHGALSDEVLTRFGGKAAEVVAWMDRASATDYATLAPVVVRHADAGEALARQLMQEAAAGIEAICRRLLALGAPRLALLGGLASVMAAWLPPDLRRRLSPAIGDAVDGAAILAGRPPAPRTEAPG